MVAIFKKNDIDQTAYFAEELLFFTLICIFTLLPPKEPKQTVSGALPFRPPFAGKALFFYQTLLAIEQASNNLAVYAFLPSRAGR